MKRTLLSICLLLAVSYACALMLTTTGGNEIDISYQSLYTEEMIEFSTFRNKNGKDINENWRGIALLPWLNKLGFDNWQSMRCVSYDAYEVVMHRIELDKMPAYLALYHEGEVIDEQDVRVIFPTTRENKWLRGVSQIVLHGYQAQPQPRYIYAWEDFLLDHPMADNETRFNILMNKAFSQKSGTIILLDTEFKPFALDYPFHLADESLVVNSDNSIELKNVKFIGRTPLKDIIYLQCGPFAYIRRDHLTQMYHVGNSLGWNWDEINLARVKGTKVKALDEKVIPKLPKDAFLELR